LELETLNFGGLIMVDIMVLLVNNGYSWMFIKVDYIMTVKNGAIILANMIADSYDGYAS
jgi:adenine/guanine phosphoribosyltransferase-like PRPP-binding protein